MELQRHVQPCDEILWNEPVEVILSQAESPSYAQGDISSLILDYHEQSGKRKRAPSLNIEVAANLIRTKKPRKSLESSPDLQVTVDPDEPFLIAHSTILCRLIDAKQLANGVRYELARRISSGDLRYEDITEDRLESLRGSNQVSLPKLPRLFHGALSVAESSFDDNAFAKELLANSPWKELDLEEEALLRGPEDGLGNNANLEQNLSYPPGWYGGKTEFRGRLVENKGQTLLYKVVLEPCAIGPSSRFSRRFGSWSFLRIKIPETIFHQAGNGLQLFLRKPFVIWGRIFRACYAKNDNIFFYWTNERLSSESTIPGRLSFEEFVTWHNPLRENSKQLMTKWSARMPLGFSNSVPGPRISQDHMLEEPDIVSATNSDMTDGCGMTTKSIHRFLSDKLSLQSLPTAFQFRLAGCKGMFLLRDDGEFNDGVDRTWVRPSQIKIRHPQGMPLDPAMLTIDILRTSHMRSPSRLSGEIIINLAENGVDHKTFCDLLKATIVDLIQGLTTWEGPDAMFNLWVNVERAGGVLVGRRAREAVGEARVRGYSNRSSEDNELEDEEDEDEDEDGLARTPSSTPQSIAWWADQISGCPSTLEETVMVLLDSGFTPQSCPVLREKLKQVVCNKIKNRTRKISLEVEQSCMAFAVPDPFGVLGPNEIQIKSSKRNLKTADGLLSDVVLGDVLIGRTPCKLPSDIRKVTAVEHPMLRNLIDVVVFSVQGSRRLIDFLAGGDYDGDTVLAIWAPSMVSQFKNADEKFSREPLGLDQSFTRDNETGDVFLERIMTLDETARIHAMQQYLLGALVDPSLVGEYSMMHLNAIYKLGYGHPRTHKLACKFARVLDASKTGYRIKRETFLADRKEYGHPHGPRWLSHTKKKKKHSDEVKIDTTNMSFLKRDKESSHVLGKNFIMDSLISAAEKTKNRSLAGMEEVFVPLYNEPDPDLTGPWNRAVDWAEREGEDSAFTKLKRKDLSTICLHVQAMYSKHKKLMANKGGSFTDLPIERRQDGLRSLSKEFASKPDISELHTIADPATLSRYRASYAYLYDAEQNNSAGVHNWTRFPWNVAMRELCAIKASAQGPYKVITNNFYERFRMVKST